MNKNEKKVFLPASDAKPLFIKLPLKSVIAVGLVVILVIMLSLFFTKRVTTLDGYMLVDGELTEVEFIVRTNRWKLIFGDVVDTRIYIEKNGEQLVRFDLFSTSDVGHPKQTNKDVEFGLIAFYDETLNRMDDCPIFYDRWLENIVIIRKDSDVQYFAASEEFQSKIVY